MPTYEYECTNCGNDFEIFQGITEPPLKKCPQCGGKVKKVISSGAGLIFKGSGFYETDYKKKSSSGSCSEKKEKGSCPAADTKSCPASKNDKPKCCSSDNTKK